MFPWANVQPQVPCLSWRRRESNPRKVPLERVPWTLQGTHVYELWWTTFVGGSELAKHHTRLYAIGEGKQGPVKFGVSTLPSDRLRGIQTHNPRPLTLLADIPSPKGFEDTVLSALQSHRIRGEWFRREGLVVEVITLMREIAEVVRDYRSDGIRLDVDDLYHMFYEDAGALGLLTERLADAYTYFWDRQRT